MIFTNIDVLEYVSSSACSIDRNAIANTLADMTQTTYCVQQSTTIISFRIIKDKTSRYEYIRIFWPNGKRPRTNFETRTKFLHAKEKGGKESSRN